MASLRQTTLIVKSDYKCNLIGDRCANAVEFTLYSLILSRWFIFIYDWLMYQVLEGLVYWTFSCDWWKYISRFISVMLLVHSKLVETVHSIELWAAYNYTCVSMRDESFRVPFAHIASSLCFPFCNVQYIRLMKY